VDIIGLASTTAISLQSYRIRWSNAK